MITGQKIIHWMSCNHLILKIDKSVALASQIGVTSDHVDTISINDNSCISVAIQSESNWFADGKIFFCPIHQSSVKIADFFKMF